MKKVTVLSDESGRPTVLSIGGRKIFVDYDDKGIIGTVRFSDRVHDLEALKMALEAAKILNIQHIGSWSSAGYGWGSGVINVPSSAEYTKINEIHMAGELVEAWIGFASAVAPTDPGAGDVYYGVRFSCDNDSETFFIDNRALTQDATATHGRCAIGDFMQQSNATGIRLHHIPLRFRNVLTVYAKQTSGAACNVNNGLVISRI